MDARHNDFLLSLQQVHEFTHVWVRYDIIVNNPLMTASYFHENKFYVLSWNVFSFELTTVLFVLIVDACGLEAETRSPPFHKRHFEMHFHERNILYFDLNFTDVCS